MVDTRRIVATKQTVNIRRMVDTKQTMGTKMT